MEWFTEYRQHSTTSRILIAQVRKVIEVASFFILWQKKHFVSFIASPNKILSSCLLFPSQFKVAKNYLKNCLTQSFPAPHVWLERFQCIFAAGDPCISATRVHHIHLVRWCIQMRLWLVTMWSWPAQHFRPDLRSIMWSELSDWWQLIWTATDLVVKCRFLKTCSC